MKNPWQFARQRDFTGGETLATLPELVQRNQMLRMENAIVSPSGEITASWQTDSLLFTQVPGGIILVPIPGGRLLTVFAAKGNDIITFTVDPESPTPYNFNAATGYPGYALLPQANAVNIVGITHGVPFLGNNYCCAETIASSFAGELTASPASLAFGSINEGTTESLSVTVTNTTASPITLTGTTITGDGASAYNQSGAWPQVLAASGTYTFNVAFAPTAIGEQDASLNVLCSAGALAVPLTGSATYISEIYLTDQYYGDFNFSIGGALNYNTKVIGVPFVDIVRLNNPGTLPEVLTNAVLSGSLQFSIPSGLPITIPAGGTADFVVGVTGTSLGEALASIAFTTTYGTLTLNLSVGIVP